MLVEQGKTVSMQIDGARGRGELSCDELEERRFAGAVRPLDGEALRPANLKRQGAEKLAFAKPDAIVMHPGPINRGVEIASEVADGPRSVILNQVTFGIAVRMAVMSMAISGQESSAQGRTGGERGQ